MNSIQTDYQALTIEENEVPSDDIAFHVASEGGKSRWNHVGDLDAFFRRIYDFHQQKGYSCILFVATTWMMFFILVTFGSLYCANCILFNFDVPPSPLYNRTDFHLGELFIPVSVCAANIFGFWSWIYVVICTLVAVYKIYKFIYHAYAYKEIQQFYECAMKIPKTDIQCVTWHEVQCHLREVQHEQQMCVFNTEITELDISHRILRYKNYMVALVNKDILPLKFKVPFFGEWVYLSSSYEWVLEFILFHGAMSPFNGSGKLKEEYKKREERLECAQALSKIILLVGCLGLFFSPVILVWQLLTTVISYSGYLRFDTGFLSNRRWSTYSRLYLRHFNELDHELNARLCRAYKPSKDYMKSFSTPLVVLIMKFLAQLCGFVVVFMLMWGLFKESLFGVPYVLLIISGGTALFTALVAGVPDENEVYFPNHLMHMIIADVHYAPDYFKTKAHTTEVRDEFSHLFQYKLVYLLEELFNPIITPYILIFHLRHKTLDIVDFLRSFTVSVEGVGDVCSFALMSVSKHGNQQWYGPGLAKVDPVNQAENGKTELSLIHFTLMNPKWEPPHSSNIFIQGFKDQVIDARGRYPGVDQNPFYSSLNSLSTIGSKYASLANSVHQSAFQVQPSTSVHQTLPGGSISGGVRTGKVAMKGLTSAEGPAYTTSNGILGSLAGNDLESASFQANLNPMEMRAADMSLSALLLHEVHDKHKDSLRSQEESKNTHSIQPEDNTGEDSALLERRRSHFIP